MQKKRTAVIPTESDEQQALFVWAAFERGRYPELVLLYHIPNGGKRDAVTGYHLKQQGAKAGIPDLCLPVARGGYHGLYIELKRTKGSRIQGNQKQWISALAKQGYKAVVCYGCGEAIAVILWYLKLKGASDGR